MPARKEHVRRDLQVLGEAFPRLHYYKDLPRVLLREKHRVWLHDPVSDIVLGIAEGRGDLRRTLKAILSGILHDLDDYASSVRKRQKVRVEGQGPP